MTENTEPNDPIRDLIYQRTLPEVEQKIDERVEDEKNKIRNGSGFMGFIMGLIFQLAEMLGIENWLADLVGQHIPTEDEKKALAAQVTSSVSDALTAKDADGKVAAARLTPDELEKMVKGRVLDDLSKNPELASAFKGHLEEVASEAASGVRENTAMIQAVLNPSVPAPMVSPQKLAGTPDEQVSAVLGTMVDNIAQNPLIPATAKPQLASMKPTMVKIGAELIKGNPALLNSPEQFSAAYSDALAKNAAVSGELKSMGIDMASPQSKAMFNQLVQPYVRQYAAALKDASAGKASEVVPQAPDMTLTIKETKAEMAKKIEQEMIAGAAEKMAARYKASYGWDSYWIGGGVVPHIATLDKAKMRQVSPEELEKAQKALYDRAAEMGYAPTNSQRERIAKTITDAAEETLKASRQDLPKEDLVNMLRANIADKLEAQREGINKTGNKLDKEFYEKIVSGMSEKLKGNDGDGLYAQIQGFQRLVQSQAPSAAPTEQSLAEQFRNNTQGIFPYPTQGADRGNLGEFAHSAPNGKSGAVKTKS